MIEAIVEELEPKQALFAELNGICGPDAILATNTSALSVSAVAAASGRPERVVGLHFFNPAPLMKLIEVVRTPIVDRRRRSTPRWRSPRASARRPCRAPTRRASSSTGS